MDTIIDFTNKAFENRETLRPIFTRPLFTALPDTRWKTNREKSNTNMYTPTDTLKDMCEKCF